MNTIELDIKRLANLIKEIKIAMLTTVDEDGCMQSRPMATLEINPDKFDGTLWFFSKTNSQKNHQLQNDQHVTLAYAQTTKNHYVSIQGHARISQDPQLLKEHWTPSLKVWFPQGLQDPELSLIGVTVDTADIWDSPVSRTEQMMKTVRSAITGKAVDENHQAHHLDLSKKSEEEEEFVPMTDDERLDEALRESFPASDPPGHYAKSSEDLRY